MATLFSVKQKALRRLGVLAVGQTMTADQDLQASSAYSALYEELQQKNLTGWGMNSDIPDMFAESVADLLAFYMVNEFGVSDSRWQRLQIASNSAEQKMRALFYPRYTPTSEAVDY